MNPIMTPLAILQKTLKKLNLEYLLPYISNWSESQLLSTEQQLKTINFELLAKQKKLIDEESSHFGIIEPIDTIQSAEALSLDGSALKLLSLGKVGSILVAGGQGSRLGFSGPKGCFPITPAKKKTLFQYFAEKTKAASELVNFPLPLAIMTSPENHQMIRDHFEEHRYFGLSKEQLFFFKQSTLPFLDDQGGLFFSSPGEVALGPNGNGSSIHAFFHSGIGKIWKEMGIEYVTFIMIDNPLADPFDLKLIEKHYKSKADVTVKCIQRESSKEKVGIVAKVDNKIRVIEYSEAPVKTWSELNEEGQLLFPIANISLFCFSISFLKKVFSLKMDLHKAYKNALKLNKNQTIEKSKAWKFEYFIFDILAYSQKTELLLYSREDTFAPLKNGEGDNSPKTVQEALSAYDRKILSKITHRRTPFEVIEIDPAFHYPTKKLLNEWSIRKIINTPYISAE